MKRKLILFFISIITLFALLLCGCQPKAGSANATYSVEKSENVVVITVENAGDAEYLVDVMAQASAEGKLSYETANGMITGIEGKANPADWSYCWMLYTSDAALSNTQYGTYEREGQALGSAVVGAEALPVIDGGIYVWCYQKF